jgi:hypothetical protein
MTLMRSQLLALLLLIKERPLFDTKVNRFRVLKSSSSHSLKSIHLYNSLSISLCSVYELQRAKMEMKLVPCLVVSILILCNVTRVRSDASNNRYKVGDDVPLYVNKVGPFHNPR